MDCNIKQIMTMKKNIFFAALLALASFGLSSCGDDETEGLSRITYYAILELNDAQYMSVQKGSTFTDPGCKATMAGQDVSGQVVATGTVDTNKLGFYSLNYKVVNSDGFAASASRTVAVVDKTNFASTYYGESQYGSRHYFNAPLSVTDNGDGTYTIDDIAGGFYCYGRYPGYEPTYDFHLEAVIKLNADNTVDLVSCDGNNWFWGDPITITSGSYDPATGKITLVLDFGGDPMTVTLTK